MDTLEAIFDVLYSDTELLTMVNEIGHLNVGQDTNPPYIIITDLSSKVAYDFGGGEVESGNYYIEAVADLESTEGSGQTITKEILGRVNSLLQDSETLQNISYGSVICFRRRGTTPSHVITRSGGEQYLMRGYEWEVVVENDGTADDNIGYVTGPEEEFLLL